MKFFSDPSNILYIGIFFTILGVAATGIGTIRNSNFQAKEQSKLRDRADEIANLQRELREKAEDQIDIQSQLIDKSQENALLNSQTAFLQNQLREKAENQVESQKLIQEKIEEISLISIQTANLQREQNNSVNEINNSLHKIKDYLNKEDLTSNDLDKEEAKNILVIQGVSAKGSLGEIKIFLSSQEVDISPGEIKHLFNGNLSFYIKIEKLKKDKPSVIATFSSIGNDIFKFETDIPGKCFVYDQYKIELKSIENSTAKLKISLNKTCDS